MCTGHPAASRFADCRIVASCLEAGARRCWLLRRRSAAPRFQPRRQLRPAAPSSRRYFSGQILGRRPTLCSAPSRGISATPLVVARLAACAPLQAEFRLPPSASPSLLAGCDPPGKARSRLFPCCRRCRPPAHVPHKARRIGRQRRLERCTVRKGRPYVPSPSHPHRAAVVGTHTRRLLLGPRQPMRMPAGRLKRFPRSAGPR
mmetsp:Transcript_31870/g.82499  ORF Transcript_31870/g.82499 Transcript_31870/m.82499 type:complete len:203 (-) Transcript_31870:566-1174(-)